MIKSTLWAAFCTCRLSGLYFASSVILLYHLFLSLLQCSADNSLVHTPTSLLTMPVRCCDQVPLKHVSSIHFLHILPSLKLENTEVITHKMWFNIKELGMFCQQSLCAIITVISTNNTDLLVCVMATQCFVWCCALHMATILCAFCTHHAQHISHISTVFFLIPETHWQLPTTSMPPLQPHNFQDTLPWVSTKGRISLILQQIPVS